MEAQALALLAPIPAPAVVPLSPSLRVSALIPTKNRPDALRRSLATLGAQSTPVAEVIIVDQSPACDRSALQALRATAPDSIPCLYLHEPNVTGGATARNRAIEFAHGDIWLFLDDDVELEHGFVAALLAAYRQRPDALGMAGLITNYPPPAWRRRSWDALFRHGLFHDDRQPLYWRAARLRSAHPLPVSRFSGSAMSFRAAAVGGLRFDARLTGVSNGEDVDFCLALTRGGRGLYIAPQARLRHLRHPTGRSQEHWICQTARDAWFLFLSHGLASGRIASRRQRTYLAWLECGLTLGAAVSALRHRSASPLRALAGGRREARETITRRPAEPRSCA